MQTFASLSFLFSALILFIAGFAGSRLSCLRGGLICLAGGVGIAIMWSNQCAVAEALQLKCNPKAAVFLGMGVGLCFRSLFPSAKEDEG